MSDAIACRSAALECYAQVFDLGTLRRGCRGVDGRTALTEMPFLRAVPGKKLAGLLFRAANDGSRRDNPGRRSPMSASGVFLDRGLIQERTAKMLLEVRAVQFSASNPFFFTSGWASPVYIDCRKLISYPHLRQTVIDFATSTIIREIGVECVDGVAGGETAGIPFAAWIADRLILPMQYIRKRPQGFRAKRSNRGRSARQCAHPAGRGSDDGCAQQSEFLQSAA